MSGGKLNNSGSSGIVVTGCGCTPIGILLSIVLSVVGTVLANLFLMLFRRRQ